ncbi:uncharacterized protein VNE69_03257 [Vairimorpha necatrix]|uniref:Uncharacterized protein n=1 Tax=Vairimorpha necatrix TaxID=6039 RepID=A0AAX4JAZ7_9MICR
MKKILRLREELLDLAINGKRLKDCKYKIVVAYEHRGKEYSSSKDIEGEDRIFLIRDEFCLQAAETLESLQKMKTLTKIFSDLRQNRKKYVPVDKAIKVIKNGLSDNPTVSHKEFFLSELNIEQLGKDMKVDSKHHNGQL